MPGKPYSMREMKQIVDYLVDNKAFGEIKGRKMWINLENSKILDRTWQSLKETFIKRILPDLHNPYYKLTVEQIASFRKGQDVSSSNQKLEIHTISDSNSNADSNKDKGPACTTSKEQEQNNTGEEKKCSKIGECPRSSTETLVLENCYENGEELLRDLESPKNDIPTSAKSLRDCFMYSEPLTPMLQDVLHDFDTDDDDDEPQMQIVEDAENENINNEEPQKNVVPDIRQSASFEKITQKTEQVNGNLEFTKPEPSKIKSLKLKKTQKGTWENKEPNSPLKEKKIETNNNISKDDSAITEVNLGKECKEDKGKPTQNSCSSNATTDTQLPNNQEGLLMNNNNNSKRTSTESTSDHVEKEAKKVCKRSHSQTIVEPKKKSKKKKFRSSSEIVNNVNGTEKSPSSGRTSNEGASGDNSENIAIDKDQSHSKEPSPAQKEEEKCQGADNADVHNIPPAKINPCLKSVSLFEEQFSALKFDVSESNENQGVAKDVAATINEDNGSKNDNKADDNNQKDKMVNPREESSGISNKPSSPKKNTSSPKEAVPGCSKANDVVLLKSHSESDYEKSLSTSSKPRIPQSRVKMCREKVLSNLFGFSSVRTASRVSVRNRDLRDKSRFKQYAHRKSTNSNKTSGPFQLDSSDDEYTTESESETPPRKKERMDRYFNKKYVRPSCYDILSNTEGGKFVAIGRKVYPLLLRDGNSLRTLALDDSNGEESYWERKFMEENKRYLEEKIRADELAKLLEITKKLLEEREQEKTRSLSPILQSKRLPTPKREKIRESPELVNGNGASSDCRAQAPFEPKKTVKIKFTKDHEIEVEGTWSQMEPAMEKMAAIFGSRTEPERDSGKAKTVETNHPSTSRQSTPVIAIEDPEAHQKVNEIESQIFKQIEEIDKQEKSKVSKGNKKDENVTKTPEAKKLHEDHNNINQIASKTTEMEKGDDDNKKEKSVTKTEEVKKGDEHVTIRRRGQPKKNLSIASNTSVESLPKRAKKSVEATKSVELPEVNEEQTEVKNKKKAKAVGSSRDVVSDSSSLPRKRPRVPKKYGSDIELARTSRKSSGEVDIPEDETVRYRFPKKDEKKSESRYSKNETRAFASLSKLIHSESTQDYQDSDVTPPKITLRKKKVFVAKKGSFGRLVRRNSHPYLGDIESGESNTSIVKAQNTTSSLVNISPSSSVYRSDSIQYLLPKPRIIKQLEKIDEAVTNNEYAAEHVSDSANMKPLSPLTINVNVEYDSRLRETNPPTTGSANSPRCNSSNNSFPLSPELSVVENLSIVQDLISDSGEHPTLNETHVSDLGQSSNYNKYLISDVDISVPLMAQNCDIQENLRDMLETGNVTESLLMKINSVDMEEGSSFDSLDQKLKDLLLESSKKLKQRLKDQDDNLMEVDPVKTGTKNAKKRSSTPRKKSSKSSESAGTLQEHRMPCSYGGRTSCPPVINIVDCDGVTQDSVIIGNESDAAPATKTRGRKKKNIIKVKILRPKRSNSTSSSKTSVCTDSGINDAESQLHESTDLIHNHSDTCLQTNECMGDSVEFIENMAMSVISLHDSASMVKETEKDKDYLTADMLSNDAQDGISEQTVSKPTTSPSGETVYMTASPGNRSFNSLMTDDLSEDVPVPAKLTKWFFFSDSESTSTTQFSDARSQDSSSLDSNCHGLSNLNKIFPLTCAVPDLSTITEISKENETARMNLDSDLDTMSNPSKLFSL